MGIQQQPQDCMFLSKIYLQQKYRGNGYAAQAIQYLEKICCLEQLHTIWLTVNKGNADSIAAYKHMGFAIARTQVADIGQGFVMDDYIMEKSLD